MTKTFAQIEATLPHSRKVRQLNHGQRWAYLCAHLTPLGGFIGTFRYPKSVWADDAGLTRDEVEIAIEELVSVGLIEYDYEDEFVRIIAWFLKKNAPENASRMASFASDFAGLEAPDDMVIGSAAEFTVGAIKRAQRWKPDSVEWEKLRDVFKPFLATMRQNFQDDFHQALVGQVERQNRAVKAELCAIMPSLEFYLNPTATQRADTVGTPCPHPYDTVGPHETRRDVDETMTRKDEIYTVSDSNENVQPLTKAHLEKVGSSENTGKPQGPRSETIESAKRMGAIP